jgi:hypothetical protein
MTRLMPKDKEIMSPLLEAKKPSTLKLSSFSGFYITQPNM